MNMTSSTVGSIRNPKSLINAIQQGFRPNFLFFYSHRSNESSEVNRACLSQWWISEFEIQGVKYTSAEHYMMAEKARLFKDRKRLTEILQAPHPANAKKLGRQISDFDEGTWEQHRLDIVARANLAKFSQSTPLRDYLLSTFDRILVEASPTDRIWGIGLPESDPRSKRPELWKGLNLLGFVLMEVRRQLALDL